MTQTRRIYLNSNIFDIIDTPAKAYWLGYLYCDGNIDSKLNYLNLWCKDKEHLVKFLMFLQSNHPIREYKECYYINVGSRHICKVLKNYGIVPNKTYEEKPLFIPTGDLAHHYWRGCIDADGCISIGKNGHITKVGLILCNRNKKYLLEGIQAFYNTGNIVNQPNDLYQWRLESSNLDYVVPTLDMIYNNAPIDIRMDRKYNKCITVKALQGDRNL